MEPTKFNYRVIAICADGHGAGKSTLARFILDVVLKCCKKPACVFSFADVLKTGVEFMTDLQFSEFDKDAPREDFNGKSIRDLLIAVGTAVRETVGDNYFAKRVIEDIKEHADGFDCAYIIDDLRFPFELKALKEAFGDALITVYLESFSPKDNQDSTTEGLIDPADCDEYFENTDTYGVLYDFAVDLVERYLKDE